MASDVLDKFGGVREAEDTMNGIVGEGAAMEFFAFLRDSQIAEIIQALMKNPSTAPIPDRIDLKFAVVSYLATELSSKGVLAVTCTLLDRFEDEIGVVLVRDILRLRPDAMVKPEVKRFIARNKADFSL